MIWLTRLTTSSEMEMLCVESLEETQTIYDYNYSAKMQAANTSSLCNNEMM